MKKTKADYIAEGRASYNHPCRVRGQITDTTMPLFGEGTSWQAKAFAEGWRIEHHLARDREEQEARRLSEQVNREPVRQHHTTDAAWKRRADRIQSMTSGYLEAMQWAETDDAGDSLDCYQLAGETRDKAQVVCTAFYDKHYIDLGAFADLHENGTRSQHDAWECAGHDLWLTTRGHGVGFWDRKMGRVGDRLAADCGWRGTFKERDAYVGDDGLVYLDN